MADKEYTVVAPDGKEVTLIGPEGASQSEILAQAQKLYKPSQQPQQERGMVENMLGFGSPIQRVYKGAIVDPFWGAAKTITGGKVDSINEMAQLSEQRTQEGRKERGSEGFDWLQLLGNFLSPVNKVLPVTGTTAARTVGTTAGTGAIMSGLQPVTDGTSADQAAQQIKNMLVGGGLGGALGGTVVAGGKLVDFIKEAAKPFTKAGQEAILYEKIKDIVPQKVMEQVLGAAKKSEEFVPGSKPTVAEATADIPEAVRLAGYQKVLEKEGMAPEFAARRAEQRTARNEALQQIGGTKEDIKLAKEARTTETTPIREEALSGANVYERTGTPIEDEIANITARKVQAMQVGGKLATEAGQQSALSKTWVPVPGMPRVAGRYSNNFDRILENLQGSREAGNKVAQLQAEKQFQQFQLNSLSERGFYPLEAAPILNKIDEVLATPGQRASTLVQQSMRGLKDKITALVNEKGVINSNDLYTIRKEIGSDIERFLPASAAQSGKWDKGLVAGLEKSLQKTIDNSITGAGGSRWKEYLNTFQEASNKIDQMKIGQFLEQKLGTPLANKENAGAFVKAMENQEKTIRKATGQTRESFADILTPAQNTQFENVLKDVVRKEAAISAGKNAKVDLNLVGKEGHQLPQFLSTTATMANALLRHVRGDANSQINQQFAKLLLNGDEFANFMSRIPKKDAELVAKTLSKSLNQSMLSSFKQRVGQEVGLAKEAVPSAMRASAIVPGAAYSQGSKQQPVGNGRLVPMQQQQGLFQQPQSKAKIQGLLNQTIQQKNVPPELARVIPALVKYESNWDVNAKNPTSSARGLFQMTNDARTDVGIPKNATLQQDIEGGIDYLLKQYRKYGDVDKALQAYNQGHYNPKSKEGKQYVAAVYRNL